MRKLFTVFLSFAGALSVVFLPQALRVPQPNASDQAAYLPTAAPARTLLAPSAVPTQASVANRAPYPDQGAAPELHNTVWLNTEKNAPLHLADLRGQVVLLEFWTFDCINCQHVLPYVRTWYERYHQQGLQVIGDHFPEFSFEANYDNLVAALKRLDVPYPVAQDNDGQTWNAYGQHYWPTLYLIDKRGVIRYTRIGEGGYAQTEAAIQALLAET